MTRARFGTDKNEFGQDGLKIEGNVLLVGRMRLPHNFDKQPIADQQNTGKKV